MNELRGDLREKGRGHWLEMLPICHRLTALAAGINSNKVELAAAVLTSHTHYHARSSPPEEQVNSLNSSQGPRSPIIASVSLPACQTTPSSRPSSVKTLLFSSSLLTQVANTMRTSATRKKATQPDGEIVDGRGRERGRETLYLNGW